MDTPTSDVSSARTASSTAVLTPADSSPTQTPIERTESKNNTKMGSSDHAMDDSDSDSDVSMSASTDEEDDHILSSNSAENPEQSQVPRKRKHLSESPTGQSEDENSNEVRKRAKPSGSVVPYRTAEGLLRLDKSLLPPEVWHRVFIFCHPRILGALLQVNKSFNTYVDPSSTVPSAVLSPQYVLQLLSPDAIWRASRLLFHNGMPGPLAGSSELEMWKLACSSRCQFCGKMSSHGTMDQWHPGPGENGVARIWTFGVRSCGPCLEQKTTKEIDLFLSSAIASPLLAALPFIFFTNEQHALSAHTLQSGQPPPNIQITKRFLNTQVEEIKGEFEDAKALGTATAEEWLKGLEERGKEKKADSARWERWESTGGVLSMRRADENDFTKSSISTYHLAKKEPVGKSELAAFNGISPVSRYPPTNSLPPRSLFPFLGTRSSHSIQTSLPMIPATRFESPSQNTFPLYPPARLNPQRHERTKEEVVQMKAVRKAEIERRCMSLEPPLTPGVLAHMPSFQAAIQIIQPITDGSWEVLKPRLLSQREEAEQREIDRLAQIRVAQEHTDERQHQDTLARSDSKDLVDREWDDVQAPLRARIGGYADETIYNGWDRGKKVNYDTSPKFAADVLIYVRKRFYAEITKDEAAMRATGREPVLDPPNGPFLRKLVLENMKWVFDTKIKPHTEPYRKEIFLCNDPHCGVHSKWYGFEGVIQHFAAKHTSTLSHGSVVVHWKSEWPEYPPFNPDPSSVSSPLYYNPAPGASVPYVGNGPVLQQSYAYGGYQPAPVSAPIPAPMVYPLQTPLPGPMQVSVHAGNPHGYQESQAPYPGPPRYGEQFPGHQHSSYPPTQSYQDSSQGYQVQHYPSSFSGGYSQAPQQSSQQVYNAPVSTPNQVNYGPSAKDLPYHPLDSSVPARQDSYVPQDAKHPPNYNQPASAITAQPLQKSEEYKAQLKEVGKSVREIWNAINPIKELPGSVKVYTIIHHLLENSRANHRDDPTLSMIMDGLSNNKEMRPARNVNGLLCRSCVLGLAGSKPNQPKKHFSFPQLMHHFHTIHEPVATMNNKKYSPDWRHDMVELNMSKLSNIFKGLRKDDQRLRLVTEAIPELLPTPVSKVEDIQLPSANGYAGTTPHSYSELAPSRDHHQEYYYQESNNTEPLSAGHTAYESGEYDPRDPRELPIDVRPVIQYDPPSEGHSRRYGYESSQDHRVARRENDGGVQPHTGWRETPYVEQRPSAQHLQERQPGVYERSAGQSKEFVTDSDRQPRIRDAEQVEQRIYYTRSGDNPLPYISRDAAEPHREYRAQNRESYQGNLRNIPQAMDISARNRIFDVVAQISQQAQRAHERLPIGTQANAGSEDGEIRAGPFVTRDNNGSRQDHDADGAAERFLDTFLRDPPREDTSRVNSRHDLPEGELDMGYQRDDLRHRVHQPMEGDPRSSRYGNDLHIRPPSRGRPGNSTIREVSGVKYMVDEPPSLAQFRTYPYEDRQRAYEPSQTRERSPELVDRRYKVNNAVYRDERQNSHPARRTPSRYARYESVRLENDRARSRSPEYVKNAGGQVGYDTLRSPVGPPPPPESAYRAHMQRSAVEDLRYENAPREEYHRVLPTDSRPPRSPEAYELMRVTDAQGEYVVRRPIHRGPESFYAPYDDEGYSRRPMLEDRPVYRTGTPVQRSSDAQFEEYDPRHPEPPSVALRSQPSRY